MDYLIIYDNKQNVVAEGYDKAAVCAEARQKHDGSLIGIGTRPNGSTYGFFVSQVPHIMGM